MNELLEKVKKNLILTHDEDDDLILGMIDSAINYAESFQHLDDGYYNDNPMSGVTEQGIIMLVSHFYESRDGSTGGFFRDNVRVAESVWVAVHRMLRMAREWKL